jgi:hypothetical protein
MANGPSLSPSRCLTIRRGNAPSSRLALTVQEPERLDLSDPSVEPGRREPALPGSSERPQAFGWCGGLSCAGREPLGAARVLIERRWPETSSNSPGVLIEMAVPRLFAVGGSSPFGVPSLSVVGPRVSVTFLSCLCPRFGPFRPLPAPLPATPGGCWTRAPPCRVISGD